MIDSVFGAEVANAERFERVGISADAESASRIREEFAGWLERFFALDPMRSSDLVLAMNEALANAAEFAYLTTARPVTIDVVAHHDPDAATLIVTVSDQGVWRTPDPQPATRARGRGIPLMKALSDRASIETSTAGTRVNLRWDGVSRP
jgi:serine/threonine-protein kinase RsbW